jgi:thymidylate synthase
MSIQIGERYVEATTLSEGWLGAAAALRRAPGRKAVHLMVRIAKPDEEVEEIREAATALMAVEGKKAPIETVRNTMFPARWAERHKTPEDLALHYRKNYKELREFAQNRHGTYFGRVVAFPRDEAEEDLADQLNETVQKLIKEQIKGNKSSRYEINIYSEQHDGQREWGFPCLAHLSVHMHEEELHMQAVYRNEFAVQRGYGNFLGVAELQAFIAASVALEVGELMITIGHGEFEGAKGRADEILGELWAEMETLGILPDEDKDG